jgi:tRNA G18 (ribose-2'-O)-methylase SpoU
MYTTLMLQTNTNSVPKKKWKTYRQENNYCESNPQPKPRGFFAATNTNSEPRGNKTGLEAFPLILVLDNIRSVYNVGSIFRSAETARLQEIGPKP